MVCHHIMLIIFCKNLYKFLHFVFIFIGSDAYGDGKLTAKELAQVCNITVLEAEELIEQYDAIVKIWDHDGKTPLQYAFDYRYDEIGEYLHCYEKKQKPPPLKEIGWTVICCLLFCIATVIGILSFTESISNNTAINIAVGVILSILGIGFCIVGGICLLCVLDEYDILLCKEIENRSGYQYQDAFRNINEYEI